MDPTRSICLDSCTSFGDTAPEQDYGAATVRRWRISSLFPLPFPPLPPRTALSPHLGAPSAEDPEAYARAWTTNVCCLAYSFPTVDYGFAIASQVKRGRSDIVSAFRNGDVVNTLLAIALALIATGWAFFLLHNLRRFRRTRQCARQWTLENLKAVNDTGSTLGASLYLSALTLTTVGYGDVVPLNGGGRILGACVCPPACALAHALALAHACAHAGGSVFSIANAISPAPAVAPKATAKPQSRKAAP